MSRNPVLLCWDSLSHSSFLASDYRMVHFHGRHTHYSFFRLETSSTKLLFKKYKMKNKYLHCMLRQCWEVNMRRLSFWSRGRGKKRELWCYEVKDTLTLHSREKQPLLPCWKSSNRLPAPLPRRGQPSESRMLSLEVFLFQDHHSLLPSFTQ